MEYPTRLVDLHWVPRHEGLGILELDFILQFMNKIPTSRANATSANSPRDSPQVTSNQAFRQEISPVHMPPCTS